TRCMHQPADKQGWFGRGFSGLCDTGWVGARLDRLHVIHYMSCWSRGTHRTLRIQQGEQNSKLKKGGFGKTKSPKDGPPVRNIPALLSDEARLGRRGRAKRPAP